jgi:nitrogen-specific signal transduction histidine kinase
VTDLQLNHKIVHDVKNQLSGITTAVWLFMDGLLGEVTEEQKKYLLMINQAAGNIHDLIKRIDT